MRIEIRRNRHRHSAARRPMTSRATDAAHVYMPRVIEFHSETHQPRGKWLHRSGFRIGVTNGANRTVGRRELLRVTTGTRKMLRRAGAFRHGRIRIASMAKQTRKTRVIATVVLKLRVIESFRKLHLLLWRLPFKTCRGVRVRCAKHAKTKQ